MSNNKTLLLTVAAVATLTGSLMACGSGGVPYLGEPRDQEVRILRHSLAAPFCTRTATLGITSQTIGNYGVKIKSVQHGSLANRLHLECGDIILSINGCRVRSVSDLRIALKDAGSRGDTVKIKVDNVRARRGHGDQRFVVVQGHLSKCSTDTPFPL